MLTGWFNSRAHRTDAREGVHHLPTSTLKRYCKRTPGHISLDAFWFPGFLEDYLEDYQKPCHHDLRGSLFLRSKIKTSGR